MQHYPHNTISVTAWCRRCGRNTHHMAVGGRVGGCLQCRKPEPPAKVESPQLRLWEAAR